MGVVHDDFVRELADCRRRYAKHPEREILHLLLLALEREEVVAVSYREAVIAKRLATLPVDDEIRDLLRQALVWIWQDEEMHAVYVRGLLLRLGRRGLGTRAILHQLAGGIGGWAGSVRQHLSWSRAPIARLVATVITALGVVAGKVPRAVRSHLRLGPFRDFCAFNVDAERTAALCFARLHELLTGREDFPAALAADVHLAQEDEERHGRLFAIIGAAFDQHDQLVAGMTAARLAHQIGEVGRNFLPRAWRGVDDQLLGSMAPVTVLVDDPGTPSGVTDLLTRLLDEMQLDELVRARAAALGKPVTQMRVVIKPSFMFAYHRDDPSPTTDPQLVGALATRLRRIGCADVAVVESPSVYDRFFARRSVAEVAAYVGLAEPGLRIVDALSEQVVHHHGRGMAQYTIARTWKDADLRISVGKLRSHPTDEVMLTLSNLEWLGASYDDLLFLERQAHRQTATMMQICEFPPQVAILDAYAAVPDGVVGMMGSRRPCAPRRLYGGTDALAVDVVAARHVGLRDPRAALYLRTACNWLGVTRLDPVVRGCDVPLTGWRGPHHNGWSAFLCLLAFPLYVLASGRGAVFVPAMDERAFPPVARVGWCLRGTRWLVRRILGLRTSFPASADGRSQA